MSKKVDRESFIFYQSFENGIQHLADNEQLQVYRAISRYSLSGEIPQLTGYAAMAWELIFPVLNKQRKGFENGVKGAEFGKLGGNPNFKKGKRNPYYQDNPQDNPTDTYTDTYTDTDTKKGNKSRANTRFIPPTIEEVKAYISDNGYLYVDAEAFINYYESIGWKVGKNNAPMKDWRASVRSWQSRKKKESIQQTTSTNNTKQEWF